jgi:hypothetical protein
MPNRVYLTVSLWISQVKVQAIREFQSRQVYTSVKIRRNRSWEQYSVIAVLSPHESEIRRKSEHTVIIASHLDTDGNNEMNRSENVFTFLRNKLQAGSLRVDGVVKFTKAK